MKFALLTTNHINPLCIKGSLNQVFLTLLFKCDHISLYYPYKILRYWYGMHKYQPNYLSILYIMYSIIHIRYCVLLPSPSPPLSPSPPYIYVQYFTQSCVNIQLIYRHYLSISLVSSISPISSLIYLSNIYYIYNKYPIYLSLPLYLYTHDSICSIFIIDYVNI